MNSNAVNLIDAHPEDEAFLYELFSCAKLEEIAGANWPATEREAFLRTQYQAQRHSYSLRYPHASNQIMLCDGEKVGRILTARAGSDIAIVDIVLMPAWRNRGLASALIRNLQNTASAEGKGLCLHVLVHNPAQRLYERLGFRADGMAMPYIKMRWNPST